MKIATALLLITALLASPTWAAKDSREKQMLRRVQQQAQQAEQARVQAEQEKAGLLAEKDTLEKEFQQTQSEVSSAKRQAGAARAENARLDKELADLRKELVELKTKLENTDKALADSLALQRTTAQNLITVENAKKQVDVQLLDKGKSIKLCQDHNGRLYQIGRELMVKYREKSCTDTVLQNEPFTGLKKVEVENLFETWRDNLDREKIR